MMFVLPIAASENDNTVSDLLHVVPVRLSARPSRSIDFGDVFETD